MRPSLFAVLLTGFLVAARPASGQEEASSCYSCSSISGISGNSCPGPAESVFGTSCPGACDAGRPRQCPVPAESKYAPAPPAPEPMTKPMTQIEPTPGSTEQVSIPPQLGPAPRPSPPEQAPAPAEPAARRPPIPPPPQMPSPVPNVPGVLEPRPAHAVHLRPWKWATLAGGIVLAGGGAALLAVNGRFGQQCWMPGDLSTCKTLLQTQSSGATLVGVGGAALLGAVVLFTLDGRQERRRQQSRSWLAFLYPEQAP